MVFIDRKLLFGVNLIRCIWMTLDRKLPAYCRTWKERTRVKNLFNPLAKTNAEVVWLFPINSKCLF